MALIPPKFIDCVVAIGTKINGKLQWVGTGFLFGNFAKELENGQRLYNIFLVTNKHVFAGKQNAVLRFNSETINEGKDFESPLNNVSGDTEWLGHPDPNIDVAVIRVEFEKLKGFKASFFQSDKQSLDIEHLKLHEISEGKSNFCFGISIRSSKRH